MDKLISLAVAMFVLGYMEREHEMFQGMFWRIVYYVMYPIKKLQRARYDKKHEKRLKIQNKIDAENFRAYVELHNRVFKEKEKER